MSTTPNEADSPKSRPVGPQASIGSFFKNYAQFKGYSTRGEFWWPWLILFLTHLALGVVTAVIVGTAFPDDVVTESSNPAGSAQFSYQIWFEGTAGTIVTIAAILHFLIWAATISPLLAVTWRRFHDTGLPGPIFFLWFIPVIGWIIVLILLARGSKPEKRRPEWDAPAAI
ncbi:DUF805 domain-containing protein [Nesterenkonia halotolerans]|uniref:Uncharacterized membrane protein YhaH (DUF805 family) n=1 Tax=Nesterenkonia halotolerans TaxID=225325 RepID=A0ABR9J5Z8_9MICC|nr:DUF805 domain-containing protein [Nesterenkonia halotolerans]MBE1514404.1 uncharacterized membrane protein YhaH (DUF805 family) [Nesterenkonia halotolerans]